MFGGWAACPAAERKPAEPPVQTVTEQPDPATPGAVFQAPADPAEAATAFYSLDKTRVRMEYRDQILHLTVLSGLLRLDLANGMELVILSTGDDIEIAGLTPATLAVTPAAAAGARRALVELRELPGDEVDASHHRLRLVPAVPLRLRNNGGYPVAINSQGHLLRLDEGGSGIALNADGTPVVAAAVAHANPRTPANPAHGGSSPAALFKP